MFINELELRRKSDIAVLSEEIF